VVGGTEKVSAKMTRGSVLPSSAGACSASFSCPPRPASASRGVGFIADRETSLRRCFQREARRAVSPCSLCFSTLPTETKVESGTSQSKSGTSVRSSNSGDLQGGRCSPRSPQHALPCLRALLHLHTGDLRFRAWGLGGSGLTDRSPECVVARSRAALHLGVMVLWGVGFRVWGLQFKV
jgi:hypothetical protein